MAPDQARRIAIVGAGPAGLYAALAAVEFAEVDVFDELPAPYGLVRYGVAADHAKTKTIVRVFQRLFQRPDVRFFGNVTVGRDVSRDELLRHYDAVIYATGARHDRDLGIPGEHLVGSHGAADLVAWYSAHPDSPPAPVVGKGVAVIGAGNVALDVVRILAKDADALAGTDMPDTVLDVLRDSAVTDVHLIARRGPAQAKFTPVELRELGELDVDIVIDPADLEVDQPEGPRPTRNVAIMTDWAARPQQDRPRRIHLHFWSTPTELTGTTHVAALSLWRQRPGTDGETVKLDVQLVVRAIGYRATPLPGVPFDEQACVVPNEAGRVGRGEYVAGWLKRGPTGVIGTNKSDANETVATLAADLDSLPRRAVEERDAIVALLAGRGVAVVDWTGWQRLEAHEAALGQQRNALTVKVADRAAMLAICLGE